jgi:hypothetical protein
MNDRHIRQAMTWIAFSAVAFLGGLALLLLSALAFRSCLTYQINYNEGWNAYFVQRVIAGLPLYPPDPEAIINNYPPVSFYLVAALSVLTGDIPLAGRLLSWAAFLGCTLSIGGLLGRMGCHWIGIICGVVVWAALMTIRFDLYVGMFDPQMTAHCVMLVGFFLLLGCLPNTPLRTLCSAALVVTAGAIKHNILALPITIVLWLAAYHRRVLVVWLLGAASVAIAELAIFRIAYGPELIHGITAARGYVLSNAYTKMVHWIGPIAPLVGMATLPAFTTPRDPFAVLIGLYMAMALAIGCLGAAGEQTNYNVIFDVAISASLGIGYLVGRSGAWSARSADDPDRVAPPGLVAWASVSCAFCLLLAGAQVADATTTNPRRWLARERMREAETAKTIQFIASQPGPAMCDALLICFWAGKPFLMDPFNYSQAVLAGTRDPGSAVNDIRAHRYSVIQTTLDQTFLPPAVIRAIAEHYRPVAGMNGVHVPAIPSGERPPGAVPAR